MNDELDEFLARWIRERGQQVSIEEALREVQDKLNQLRAEHGHNPARPARYRHRMLRTR